MRAVKGRILEIGEKSIIVLTFEGEFLQRPLPKGDIQVGDEIMVPVPKPLPYLSHAASAVAAVAVVLCLLWSSVGTMAAPAYYVHVDIPGNSSVELALSRNMRVLEATPLNELGDAILTEAPVVRKSAKKAIESLIGTAENLEYFAPDKENTVLISVAGGRDKVERRTQQLIRELSAAAKLQLESAKTSVTLGVATVDSSKREEALSKKSSINELLYKNELQGKESIPKQYKVSKVVPKKHEDQKTAKGDNDEKEKSSRKNKDKIILDKQAIFNIFKELDKSKKKPSNAPGKSGKNSNNNSLRNDEGKWDGSIWEKYKKDDKRRDENPGKDDSPKKNVKGSDKYSKDNSDRNDRSDKNDNKRDDNRRDNKKDTEKRNYDRDDDKSKWYQDKGDSSKDDSKKWNWYDWKDNNIKNDKYRGW